MLRPGSMLPGWLLAVAEERAEKSSTPQNERALQGYHAHSQRYGERPLPTRSRCARSDHVATQTGRKTGAQRRRIEVSSDENHPVPTRLGRPGVGRAHVDGASNGVEDEPTSPFDTDDALHPQHRPCSIPHQTSEPSIKRFNVDHTV